MIKTIPALLTLFVATAPLNAATYYVATNGNDSNPGTFELPFRTPQRAVTNSALAPGDTIYVRGGTYALNSQIKPGKAGAAGNPIKFWAYPGELPVFDFAGMPAGTTKALDLRRDYWHVKGFEVKNAPDSGIFISGRGQIVEGCVVHDCKNDGIIFGSTTVRATNCLVLNCDSYRNYAGGDGNNGDGFAAKAGCGPGNAFIGCRAWNNADDGWDFYDNTNNSVVLLNCWSFANGFNLWGYTGTWNGNGNGFKLGGAGTRAGHYLTNCITFGNRSKGFDHNHSQAGQTIVNCTGYSNNAANFSFYETPVVGTNLLINNVAFTGTLTNLDPTTVQISNSWQLVTVTASDFASLDIALALAPRNADYSLPTNAFLRLAPGSQLIDKGVNVGLPFNGNAPDLGAFEFAASLQQTPSWFDLSGCYMTNGAFRLKIDGLTGHGQVVIHISTNAATWQPLYTNPPVTGSLIHLDGTAAGRAQTFYRVEER